MIVRVVGSRQHRNEGIRRAENAENKPHNKSVQAHLGQQDVNKTEGRVS